METAGRGTRWSGPGLLLAGCRVSTATRHEQVRGVCGMDSGETRTEVNGGLDWWHAGPRLVKAEAEKNNVDAGEAGGA